MQHDSLKRNAVIAVRVSSEKQFHEGDSPEAQREQLKRLANSLDAVVKKTFVFAESGAKANQPMQAAIDYCRDPKNNIQLFLIKSIPGPSTPAVRPWAVWPSRGLLAPEFNVHLS